MAGDQGLATILQYENVAWYEDGRVKILDRRTYPYDFRYEVCNNHKEVAQAITDMVTQSAGPYTAAGMGMVLAADEAEGKSPEDFLKYLKEAGETISSARPTTKPRMEKVTNACIKVAEKALENGENPKESILKRTLDSLENRYSTMQKVGDYLADIIPDNGLVMTMCYAETVVGTTLRRLRELGKSASFIVPETRPFLQGARLTASVITEMGFDATLITDNMVAWALDYYDVDLCTSGADSITKEGYVVNKVGTLGLTSFAKLAGVPYYVTGIPDPVSVEDIEIEFRDSLEVKSHLGKVVTLENVGAVYPSFDITPPENVRGYVTDQGILQVKDLEEYKREKEFY